MSRPELTPDELGPPELSNPTFSDDVYRRSWGAKAAAEAKRIAAEAAWAGFEDQGSLQHQIDNPEPDIGWCVEGLIPGRGSVQINAQWKVGKTSLAAVNLATCLATGKPFLRRYPVHMESHESVAIWNLEVHRQTLVDWIASTGIPRASQQRIHPLSLTGKRIDLLNPVIAADTVKWLVERGIAVWIIDPLSKLYLGDENSNSEYNEWWAAVQDIASRAGVRVVVLVHHTGHTGTRARGASAMMGAPDVLITYRHSGDDGQPPPDSRRWLRAFGRNVDVPSFEIAYAPDTHELFAHESGGAVVDAQEERWAREAYNAARKAGTVLTSAELAAACGWPKRGGGYQSRMAAVAKAVSWQWLTRERDGRAFIFDVGPVAPMPPKPTAMKLTRQSADEQGGETA